MVTVLAGPSRYTPHIPRPKHAYFSEADHDKSIYVSSQGRGVWRFGICEADAFEPDDEDGSAKTITSGETQQRSICGTGNPDYARFIVAEPSSVAISASGSTGSLNVKLLNDQLQVVAEAPTGLDIACGSPQVLPTGRYSIVVEEPGQDDTIASYTLSLNLTPCCGNATIDATAGETCDDGNRVDGDCCSSFCALENTPIPAITAATMTSTQITWPALAEASGYDVVVGDLGMLRQSGGEFSGSALLCLADDDPATSVDHTSVAPIPGGAAYFLVRGVKCTGSGTFDDLGPRLAQSRDGELAASGLPCTTP
jgi:cysteine-rich repeat protein